MPQTSNNIIPSPEKLYQLARDLQQTLRNRAEDTAKLRRLSDETIQDFKDLGFFKILQPIRWGGYEMDPIVFYKVTGIIAEACMTSAWVFSVVAVHNWQISVFIFFKCIIELYIIDLDGISFILSIIFCIQSNSTRLSLFRCFSRSNPCRYAIIRTQNRNKTSKNNERDVLDFLRPCLCRQF